MCERQLVDADDVAVPLRDLVELDDRRHLSRSSDLIEKLRMHAESPNKPASTPADQYQGYCVPIICNKNLAALAAAATIG